MSIYATLWEIKVRRSHAFDEKWVRVYAQAVPAHIGHQSVYPDGDPYADFLPPVVECDPKTGDGPFYRAVVILREGKDEKVGQRYTTPLLVLTGQEYARVPFPDLMERIENALPWDRAVVGQFIGRDGKAQLLRRSDEGAGDGERMGDDLDG
jgi:hypothetical protein